MEFEPDKKFRAYDKDDCRLEHFHGDCQLDLKETININVAKKEPENQASDEDDNESLPDAIDKNKKMVNNLFGDEENKIEQVFERVDKMYETLTDNIFNA